MTDHLAPTERTWRDGFTLDAVEPTVRAQLIGWYRELAQDSAALGHAKGVTRAQERLAELEARHD